jgi:hypothetical protein
VRELYNVKNVKPGKHLFKYEFDATYYTDDVYHFKFLEDGVVYADFKMEMNDWD